VKAWSGTSYTNVYILKFLYDGWNLVAELDANNVLVRSYLWGTDLSGTFQGGGGVGGLLAVNVATNGVHFPAYDGNGNIAGLVSSASGAITARFEYGSFAEPIRVSGAIAKAVPLRFSTKYLDEETGLLHYGYRYYDPSAGRWVSRDPMGEDGGRNLYEAFFNNPATNVDRNGLDNWSNPSAGQNAPPVLIYPTLVQPKDPVNTESKKALKCFLTGQSESFVYGPNDPWTKRMQQHPHLDGVRLRIKYELSHHCTGKGGALRGIDNFNQQQLPAWDKGVWLINDLISWATDGSFGTDPGFRFGSFQLSWRARTPDCCFRTAVVLFHASDEVRLQSGSRHPIIGNPIIPVDEPLGPGFPLHNVPINWIWTEIIGF